MADPGQSQIGVWTSVKAYRVDQRVLEAWLRWRFKDYGDVDQQIVVQVGLFYHI